MVIGKVFSVGYGFPKLVPLKLLMPLLLADVDVFEISAVNVVVVASGSAAIPVLFLSFAVGGLAVVLTGNPLELMDDEFRTFAALVSLLKLLIPSALAGVDVFEISAVNVVVVASGNAAIPVLFLSFAVASLAVVFAVASLAVVFAVASLAVVFAVASLAVVFAVASLAVVFAVASLAVVFAVASLAVVLIRNPLGLMEDEFRTFAALVNVARRKIKAIDTTTTAINGI